MIAVAGAIYHADGGQLMLVDAPAAYVAITESMTPAIASQAQPQAPVLAVHVLVPSAHTGQGLTTNHRGVPGHCIAPEQYLEELARLIAVAGCELMRLAAPVPVQQSAVLIDQQGPPESPVDIGVRAHEVRVHLERSRQQQVIVV